MNLAVPADHKVKSNGEKKDEYLDFAKEMKKLWNMNLMMIPIIIDALETIFKGLIKGVEYFEIRGHVETIQPTALLRSVRILKRALET